MGMRTDCKHYQSRTSNSGEVTRTCDLGAAPDAPLRCPEDCAFFERRELSYVGWDMGNLSTVAASGEGLHELDAEAEAALADAEAIIKEATPGETARWHRGQRGRKRARRKRRRKG